MGTWEVVLGWTILSLIAGVGASVSLVMRDVGNEKRLITVVLDSAKTHEEREFDLADHHVSVKWSDGFAFGPVGEGLRFEVDLLQHRRTANSSLLWQHDHITFKMNGTQGTITRGAGRTLVIHWSSREWTARTSRRGGLALSAPQDVARQHDGTTGAPV